MPKVSIIIPTFNRAQYIGQSVKSVLRQSFDELEVIIIDDGSDDDTKIVLAKYQTDERLHYHYQPNQGRSAARNRGIEAALGEWIVFLDSDDELVESAVETLLKHASENPDADIIVGRAEYIDGEGRSIRGPYAAGVGAVARGLIHRPYLRALRDVFFSPGSYMVRTRLIMAYGIRFDTAFRAAEDLDFAFQLAAHGNIFDTTDIVQRYRFHGANTERTEVRRTAIDVALKHLAVIVPQFAPSDRDPATARLHLNIGDNYFLLNDNRNALKYYVSSLKYDPGVIFDSNVIRQIASSSIPSGLLKYLRQIRRGKLEN